MAFDRPGTGQPKLEAPRLRLREEVPPCLFLMFCLDPRALSPGQRGNV